MTATRRSFLKSAAALAAAPLVAPTLAWPAERAFRLCLNPGTIGVAADQRALLRMAVAHGFEAIISMPGELATFTGSELREFVEDMRANDITWGSSNLPVDFRTSEEVFREGLAVLPTQAAAMERAGAQRMNTWIMPFHDTLTYSENMRRHAARLGECARILGDHGVRLGLEYVGPKTLLVRGKYPFLRTMKEARELIAAIGAPNVGLVLDSFHWYCAEDSADDIRALSNADIVTVDLNDGRADLTRDAQIDGTRELPGATGVIDLTTFLSALVDVGYDGPVRAEPFNKALNDMDDEQAVIRTHRAMRAAFARVE